MKKNVLITQPWPASYVTKLDTYVRCLEKAGFNVILDSREKNLTEQELIETLPGIFAHIAGVDQYTAKAIDAGDQLKIICRIGVGVENVDIPAATKKGILVTNTPGIGAETVAEFAFALLMTLSRRVIDSQNVLRSGDWKRNIGSSLYRKTLGIVGFGNIGKQLARLVSGFDMDIVAYDPYPDEEYAKANGVKLIPLEELLKISDFVSVHVPLNAQTTNLIAEDELAMMKLTAMIINTSRGGIINEDALYHALKDGIIAGAALDVFVNEPPCLNHPLFKLDNIITTAHNAGTTYEGRNKLMEACVDAVLDIVNGKKPIGLKNGEIWDSVSLN